MKLLKIILILLFPAVALAGLDTSAMIMKFNELLTTKKCTEKIWPGLNWSQKNIYFVNHSEKTAQKYVVGKNDLENVDYEKFKSVGIWKTMEDNNKSSLALKNITSSADLYVMLHEGFHIFEQREHKDKWSQGSRRGFEYPFDVTPRIYRANMYNRMLDTLNEGDPQNLRKAKFWYNKWIKEFPRDREASVDTIEGTAEYFYHMSQLLFKDGCDVTDDVYFGDFDLIKKYFYNKKMDGVLNLQADRPFDAEYYQIGSLATFMLRFFMSDDWILRINQKQDVLAALFDGISELPDKSDDKNIENNYLKIQSHYNNLLAPILDPSLKQLRDKEVIRVEVTINMFNPLFSGFTKNDEGILVLSGDTTMSLLKKDVPMKGNTVIFSLRKSPCAKKNSLFVLVPREEVSKLLPSEQNPVFLKDQQGFQYLCN